jgi:hypothetical protein
MQSQIQRMNGPINTVNDQVIAGQPAFGNSTTRSMAAGQLGMSIVFDDANVICDTSVGQVYGGEFQYVRLSAGSTEPALGQIVFWDVSVAVNLYQVTTLETGTVPGAQFMAGIVLNPDWTPGYYSYIQTLGLVDVKYRAVLTAAPAGVGAAVYAAAAGAGADNGLADILDAAVPTLQSDVTLMQNRYIGASWELAVGGATSLVFFNPRNRR